MTRRAAGSVIPSASEGARAMDGAAARLAGEETTMRTPEEMRKLLIDIAARAREHRARLRRSEALAWLLAEKLERLRREGEEEEHHAT